MTRGAPWPPVEGGGLRRRATPMRDAPSRLPGNARGGSGHDPGLGPALARPPSAPRSGGRLLELAPLSLHPLEVGLLFLLARAMVRSRDVLRGDRNGPSIWGGGRGERGEKGRGGEEKNGDRAAREVPTHAREGHLVYKPTWSPKREREREREREGPRFRVTTVNERERERERKGERERERERER